MALPKVEVELQGGRKVVALVDSGCSQTIASHRLVRCVQPRRSWVTTVDGSKVRCGLGNLELRVQGKLVQVRCLVPERLLTQFDLVLGVDMVQRLGGMAVSGDLKVRFGGVDDFQVPARVVATRNAAVACSAVTVETTCSGGVSAAALCVEDVDFRAKFDGLRWTVWWKWTELEPKLHNTVGCYRISKEVEEEFDNEVQSWIKEGILVPVGDEQVDTVLPLMAVEQINKGKVRPVLDYRRLNEHVSSHPGSSQVCDETIRKWRRVGEDAALLDLKKAYLQLFVDRSLWKYQAVRYKGRSYFLTRLGFGLNCAPKIMSAILRTVLAQDAVVEKGTDHYIDDILVDESVVKADVVARHLQRYGLVTKPPVQLGGARVLGLQIAESGTGGPLTWCRGNNLPVPEQIVTRRELFSICGQLVGHYPVAGWLRVACGFVKRSSEGARWEDDIGLRAKGMLLELLERVEAKDPVYGVWNVHSAEGRVWCDASSLAVGCALELDGQIVEDGAWLRKKDDGQHINLAELDSVVRGISLAAKWGLTKVELLTDSATVYGWLQAALFDTHKVRTRGMSEMLVKRRLAVVKDLCEEYGMVATVKWVKSAQNKADLLTRVSKKWLTPATKEVAPVCCVCDGADVEPLEAVIQRIHRVHHLGVNRTLYSVKRIRPEVQRKEVAAVIDKCARCWSVDPAPITWPKGDLSVEENWWRVAADVTHYNNQLYLTMVDCGPSRFAVWRRIPNEDMTTVAKEVEQLFRERGPPAEFLVDNGATFRSVKFQQLLLRWKVRLLFRCAYRPSGNGIVERNHRTIKRMAARAGGDPLAMVFYYNTTPKDACLDESVPAAAVSTYRWRSPLVDDMVEAKQGGAFEVGDRVFVKPAAVRCTTAWPVGAVTDVGDERTVEVDGMPRHIADVRAVPQEDISSDDDTSSDDEVPPNVTNKPQRQVKRPDYYGNNIYDT